MRQRLDNEKSCGRAGIHVGSLIVTDSRPRTRERGQLINFCATPVITCLSLCFGKHGKVNDFHVDPSEEGMRSPTLSKRISLLTSKHALHVVASSRDS